MHLAAPLAPAHNDHARQGEGHPAAPPGRDVAAQRRAATAFEAAFLSEMLGAAGLGAARASFGGGAGEQGFASLLTREYATAIADRGGVGLAEHIFAALAARASGDG